MKKYFAVVLLFVAGSAFAGGPHGYGYRGYHGHNHGHHARHYNWAIPAIVAAGATAVILSQRQPVPVYQPVYQPMPAPVYVERQPNCSQWREVQYETGQIVRERICQ
jgi:hypothetical protein